MRFVNITAVTQKTSAQESCDQKTWLTDLGAYISVLVLSAAINTSFSLTNDKHKKNDTDHAIGGDLIFISLQPFKNCYRNTTNKRI